MLAASLTTMKILSSLLPKKSDWSLFPSFTCFHCRIQSVSAQSWNQKHLTQLEQETFDPAQEEALASPCGSVALCGTTRSSHRA